MNCNYIKIYFLYRHNPRITSSNIYNEENQVLYLLFKFNYIYIMHYEENFLLIVFFFVFIFKSNNVVIIFTSTVFWKVIL